MSFNPSRLFLRNAQELEAQFPSFDGTGEGTLQPATAAVAKLLATPPREGNQETESVEAHFRTTLESLLERASSEKKIRDPLQLLKSIRRWALEGLRDEELPALLVHLTCPILGSDDGGRRVARRNFSAKQARSILANAFLGNCSDPMKEFKSHFNAGGLDFRPLLSGVLSRNGRIGLAKLECLLIYFDTCQALEATDDNIREILYERISFAPFTPQGMMCSPGKRFVGQGVAVHDGVMEAPTRTAQAFVNFANPNYGYGRLTRSCTQEEILLMCCPEALVGMAFIGYMGDNEVVNVHNIRRYCRYSGYLYSFSCLGPTDDSERPCIQTILTLDACTRDHFETDIIVRDINKAYHSFDEFRKSVASDGTPNPVVSTGKWGCGAFGGHAVHKFLQQVLAAHLTGVDLEFSTFGDREGCDAVLEALVKNRSMAGEVFQLLLECKNPETFLEDALLFLNCPGSNKNKTAGTEVGGCVADRIRGLAQCSVD